VILLALAILGNNSPTTAGILALLIGFGPVVFSAISLAYPIGAGAYWRTQIGGRTPSEREQALFEGALGTLREMDPGMRVPSPGSCWTSPGSPGRCSATR